MSEGNVQIIYGRGRGKTSAALGYAVKEACHEGSVVIIEFLKRKNTEEAEFLTCLEPQVRIFRFQKSSEAYADLSAEEQEDARKNMLNGLSYARKVLQTGECSCLVLDEVLGLVDYGIVPEEELIALLSMRPENTDIILTGRVLSDQLREYADQIFEIRTEKELTKEE